MKIVFCSRCGMRLTEDMFPSGEAVREPDGKPYHRACLPSAPRSDANAPQVLPARKRPPSSRILAAPPGTGSGSRHASVGSGSKHPATSSSRGRGVAGDGSNERLPAWIWAASGFFGGLALAALWALAQPEPPVLAQPAPSTPDLPPLIPSPPVLPDARPFPSVGRRIFEASFDRQDLGGFGTHDFDSAGPPFAMPDSARGAGGGYLALGKLEGHERHALGAGVDPNLGRIPGARLRLRFRYRLNMRKPSLAISLSLDHPDGSRRYAFEVADARANRWRWFDEPLSAFKAETVEESIGAQLLLLAGEAKDSSAVGAYIDDVLLYEEAGR
ncbi:MAG: hypothetical protein HS116_02905 [Planctomycetes bacterium]|nr:hypothetical protein [Planctomycetota bacterium]